MPESELESNAVIVWPLLITIAELLAFPITQHAKKLSTHFRCQDVAQLFVVGETKETRRGPENTGVLGGIREALRLSESLFNAEPEWGEGKRKGTNANVTKQTQSASTILCM